MKRGPAPRLLLTCEHASATVPPALRAAFGGAGAALRSHRGSDLGALAVARQLADGLGVPLFATEVTRLVVDANRSPHAPRVFSEFTRELPPAARAALLRRHHAPHRERVRAAVRAASSAGRRAVHVAVHSFTPVWHGRVRRADVGLLFDPARPAERAFCTALRRALQRRLPELRILFNEPYRGWTDGLPTTLRAEFGARRYVGIELELNQGRLTTATDRRRIASALRDALSDSLPEALRSPPAP